MDCEILWLLGPYLPVLIKKIVSGYIALSYTYKRE